MGFRDTKPFPLKREELRKRPAHRLAFGAMPQGLDKNLQENLSKQITAFISQLVE
jgi:hypothetical protein